MKKTPFIQSLGLLVLALLGSGCATLEESATRATPSLELPPHYASTQSSDAADTGWIDSLGDPGLHALINEAMRQNFSLQASAARVRAALGNAEVAGASRLPTLAASLDASRSKQSLSTVQGINNRFSIGLQSSWEIDLWQRLGHRSQAAAASAEATIADFQAARLSLAANLARSWYAFNESRLQTDLAQRRVDNFNATLEAINDRYLSGIGTALDVQLARENLATAQTTLHSQQRARDAARRTLETLLGRYPAGAIEASGDLSTSIQRVPDSQPLTLLERRPDLLAARARLVAASENQIDVRRNFLPGLNLTASGGNTSREFSDLLDWDNLFWSLAGSLTQPLFQGGKLKAQRTIAQAQLDEALANYTQTALTAFREVETALAAEPLLTQQLQSQQTAADEARRAANLALERYQAGITGIVTLLETQRRAFNAESSLLSVRLALVVNRIDLHLALGGSFSLDEKQEKTS